jgi:hypothetical protein
MKIKKFHGNITILTLFILLSCALMWVLVALYMKNFIRYSDEITSYEKTSYLAKAWTELWLAIVWSREIGLVYSIDSWNLINWNFECPFPVDEWKTCPVESKFSIEIDWLWNSYQNCSTEGLKEIKPWLSAIIPLYKDSSIISSISNALIRPDESSLIKRDLEWITAAGTNGDKWNYWVVWMNWENTLYISNWQGTISNIIDKKPIKADVDNWRNPYFIVANPQYADPDDQNAILSKTQRICIQDNRWWDIAQETVKIVSIWYYNNRQLWTETLTTKALPSFLQWDNYIH